MAGGHMGIIDKLEEIWYSLIYFLNTFKTRTFWIWFIKDHCQIVTSESALWIPQAVASKSLGFGGMFAFKNRSSKMSRALVKWKSWLHCKSNVQVWKSCLWMEHKCKKLRLHEEPTVLRPLLYTMLYVKVHYIIQNLGVVESKVQRSWVSLFLKQWACANLCHIPVRYSKVDKD